MRRCEDDALEDWTPPAADFAPGAFSSLSAHLSPERRARFLKVVAGRTRYVRLVIQDVHDPHNVSACLRTAEAFGVQDVDVVTLRQRFRPRAAARGVASWLTVRRWPQIELAAADLKAKGYQLWAGLPRPDAAALTSLPLTKPIACIFGNEKDGIDRAWLPYLDGAFTIPTAGMVESLNISVSAAVTLFFLTEAAHRSVPAQTYFVSEREQSQLLDEWTCRQFAAWRGMMAARQPPVR